jgi:hypothetical protein
MKINNYHFEYGYNKDHRHNTYLLFHARIYIYIYMYSYTFIILRKIEVTCFDLYDPTR